MCPLGGLAGVSSMTGLLELRPTPDICAAKCRDHACYKGDEHVAGCPMFNHVMFVESNQHCVLCLNCLQLCPNHSPQLNVRLPALDLLPASGDRSHAGRVMVLLAGLLEGWPCVVHGSGRPAACSRSGCGRTAWRPSPRCLEWERCCRSWD